MDGPAAFSNLADILSTPQLVDGCSSFMYFAFIRDVEFELEFWGSWNCHVVVAGVVQNEASNGRC